MSELPLGRESAYPTEVDPSVLVAIDRSVPRRELGLSAALPFRGDDEWNAFELSWLDQTGRPTASVATIRVDAASRAMVESKSLKLYLGGFAMTCFPSASAVAERIRGDLATVVEGDVRVAFDAATARAGAPGFCLDDLELAQPPTFDAIRALPRGGAVGSEMVHTRLFRSVCPVTGQPDWGSIAIGYRGRLIDRLALFEYLLSFRAHPGFHEDVVERIFCAMAAAAEAEDLYVAGRFLRRGGIDINPARWRGDAVPPVWRDERQ